MDLIDANIVSSMVNLLKFLELRSSHSFVNYQLLSVLAELETSVVASGRLIFVKSIVELDTLDHVVFQETLSLADKLKVFHFAQNIVTALQVLLVTELDQGISLLVVLAKQFLKRRLSVNQA